MKSMREIVESYNVKLWPIGDGIYRGFCPMHHNVNTPSFTVYEHSNSWFCYGEGEGGPPEHFVARMENISITEARKIVQGEVSVVEDITQMLDSVAVVDQPDYGMQLNFAVSKYCRDLLVNNISVDKVFKFLQTLDKDVLTKPVTSDILNSVLAQARQLRGDANEISNR